MRRYDGCGLKNVWLVNGYEEVDTPYGRGVKYVDLMGLHRAIAAAIVDKPGTLTAEELRFLRKELLLSQKGLAELIAYLQLGTDTFKAVVDEDLPESIEWQTRSSEDQPITRTAHLPRLIFTR